MSLLAYHSDLVGGLREPSAAEPWRVLVSGCLAGWPCGVNGSDYGLGGALSELLALPSVHAVAFCPEQHALGTPRTMPDLHGGDGVDALAGNARVLDEHGADLTAAMVAGARAMVEFAREERVDLAILTDGSAACGTQVISDGCRFDEPRRYRKGLGVAAAALLEAGVPLVAQRDHATLAALRSRLEPGYAAPKGLLDHHEHPWTREHLPETHPRANEVSGRDT